MTNWPKGWCHKPGRTGIWYRVPVKHRALWDDKQWVKLGETEAEAYRTWFSHTGLADDLEHVTVEILLDQFMAEYVAIYLSDSSYDTYTHYIKPLKKAFGHLHPAVIKPMHMFQYQNYRPTASGNRETSVMSSALTFAVERGWVESNVLKGAVNRRGARTEKPRKRVPTLNELDQLIKIQPDLSGHIALKKITGMRKEQLLNINLTDHWNGEELFAPSHKGGNDTIYRGEALADVINTILNGRVPAGFLFLNRKKKQVTVTGFNSMWQRAMRKFVEAGGERFNEHDIRKLVANEAESLLHAQRLLGHTSPKVTAQVYRIKPTDAEVL